MTPDGNLERLSENTAIYFRGIIILFVAVLAMIKLNWNDLTKKNIKKKFLSDTKKFFREFRKLIQKSPKWSVGIMLAAVIAGALLRFILLDRPLLHDEAYTMAVWGRSDLAFAISDYHLPNNHLLNTFFVNLLYHLGARSAWLLRLPVFCCGIMVIFFSWLLGKTVYNDFAGVSAAGLTAVFPYLIDYSVNARGYEMQALFTLVTACLAFQIVRGSNLFSRLLFIVFSALNFFVLPTSLYPFCGICLWLVIETFREKRRRAEGFRSIFSIAVLTAVLTLLLYIPLLKNSGFDSLFRNVFIAPVNKEIFLPTLYTRIKESADIFFGSVPRLASIIILAGIILAPAALRMYTHKPVSPTLAMFLCLLLIIPIQRPNLWTRTLLYLYPMLLVSAAGGLSWAADSDLLRKPVIAILTLSLIITAVPQFTAAVENFGNAGSNERAIWKILAKEGYNAENVYVATVSEDNAPLWMYADFYHLPKKIFDRTKPFNTVYVYVNPENDTENGENTLDGVLAAEGPGAQFYDQDSMKIVMDEKDGILYRFSAFEDVVIREYGSAAENK